MKQAQRHSSGFTLVEMAIVLVIIGLLLGGLLMPLSAQIEGRRISETQKALDEINQALIGFAVANGRLPCPAPATTATGAAGAGIEPAPIVAGGCANAAGVLPWATLGVSETDSWGRRYTYRVTGEFTRSVPGPTAPTCAPPTAPLYAAFALCSQGDMTILTTLGGSTVSTSVPAVVISHGKNGNGAYTSQGAQLATGADADELDNQLTAGGTSMANTTISKTPTATFDDLTSWVSPNILFNRMVTAQKLP
ncbi:MAG: prepilin-type N-terminal cleavage/methylation domain-containing protein [Sulfuricella sp.]|nr:prepilin-type N-terminal cleavage/methylation domain-containing protein [Sulfuricella sp.]